MDVASLTAGLSVPRWTRRPSASSPCLFPAHCSTRPSAQASEGWEPVGVERGGLGRSVAGAVRLSWSTASYSSGRSSTRLWLASGRSLGRRGASVLSQGCSDARHHQLPEVVLRPFGGMRHLVVQPSLEQPHKGAGQALGYDRRRHHTPIECTGALPIVWSQARCATMNGCR